MITSYFAPKNQRKIQPTTTALGLSKHEMSSSNNKKRENADELNDNKRAKTDDPVQELIKYLDNDDNNSWRQALDRHFASKQFSTLASFVDQQRKSATVYPPPSEVFSALTLTPMESVKVVIVGQDPYHGPNQGHGLCFSVKKGVAVPPSLKNIYKELQNDAEVDFPRNNKLPTHGYLAHWAKQGVLLLNAVLTVRKGEANSHKNKGWETVTDEILRTLVEKRRESGKGLVFLLWGKPAAKKIESVLGKSPQQLQRIISTSHPSPLGATKTASPFLGSKCFSRANQALVELGLEPVDWNVDEVLLEDV